MSVRTILLLIYFTDHHILEALCYVNIIFLHIHFSVLQTIPILSESLHPLTALVVLCIKQKGKSVLRLSRLFIFHTIITLFRFNILRSCLDITALFRSMYSKYLASQVNGGTSKEVRLNLIPQILFIQNADEHESNPDTLLQRLFFTVTDKSIRICRVELYSTSVGIIHLIGNTSTRENGV